MKKAKIILIAASAAMLLTGCMSREETERISAWAEERYTAQAMAVQETATWQVEQEVIQIDATPAPTPAAVQEQTEMGSPETLPVMEMASSPAASEPSPTPETEGESPPAPAEKTPISKIEWPYPCITCPPEPTATPVVEWPYPSIACPPEPTPTPDIPTPSEPDPTPAPTATPVEPVPTPAPTPEPAPVETPPAIPEPTPTPAGGYAVCSCGATLTPDELVGHMKAHAMNGENHSYSAN